MITRMEITFRSKEPCDKKPQIFSPGSCRIVKDEKELLFDFLDTESSIRHEGDYLYVDCLYKNFDEGLLEDFTLEEADKILRAAVKEDFIEVNYECYSDLSEEHLIEMTPLDMTFYDYSSAGDGNPIKVQGHGFTNANNFNG